MCGIFGVIVKEDSTLGNDVIFKVVENLAIYSQVRGKDSSGMAFRDNNSNSIKIIKGPVSIDSLLKTTTFKNQKKELLKQSKTFSVIGHARLVTNGSQLQPVNNQPIYKDNIIGIHNGIIVNEYDLWKKYPVLKREYEIDTEVLFALFNKNLNCSNDISSALKKTNDEISGTVATGFFIRNQNDFILYTNNGSLYMLTDSKEILVFASERNILELIKSKYQQLFGKLEVHHISSNHFTTVNQKTFEINHQNLLETKSKSLIRDMIKDYDVQIVNQKETKKQLPVVIDIDKLNLLPGSSYERSLLSYDYEGINKLVRCSKCLLPETFPFIEFNKAGVCNYCLNYQSKKPTKTLEDLDKIVSKIKIKNGRPNCIVPFSGGRDSTYTLNFVKHELKLNPIAYTYDWGMVTDLARRNIARVCGNLGVEHIIVAANIHQKRKNIKNNILAWLKRPKLGMVPLFMAGDKYFNYYSNVVSKQNDVNLSIWGSNAFENTDFKVGFAGIKPKFDKKRIDEMDLVNKLKLLYFFGESYLMNPSYLNSSLIDTFGSFLSRYMIKRVGYLQLFDYIQWEEKEIERLIFEKFDWERATDTFSTWRIGDGTAAFYNYIYLTISGFTENDTFRSNQIREGMMTREEGLRILATDNLPRYENLKWYLEIVGLDFKSTIRKINKIPRLY